MSTLTSIKYLYKASLPGSKIELKPDDIGISSDALAEDYSQLDSLLFAIEVDKLSFNVALCVLSRAFMYRDHLALYRSFFDQCRTKFRTHHMWHDMACFSVPLA